MTQTLSPRTAARWLAVLAAAAPAAGCMNLSGLGGASQYACRAPEGVTCQSVSGTYANSAATAAGRAALVTLPPPLPVSGTATASARRSDGAAGWRPASQAAAAAVAAEVATAGTTAGTSAGTTGPRTGASSATDNDPPPDAGTPLRRPPRVLRLWLKPWEDTDGDLHDPGHVYVLIDSGRWTLDHIRRRSTDPQPTLQPSATRPVPGSRSAQPEPPAARAPAR